MPAGDPREPGVGPNPADTEQPAPQVSVVGDRLKAVMAEFSSGVTVVTAETSGRLHAMTATAFCSVSLDPPLVLVCVGKTSRFHAAIMSADAWAVSLLSEHQGWIARHFSHRGRDLLTQFSEVPHARAPSSGAPVIQGARGWLDCVVFARHDAGDHTIVVGRVVAASPQAAPGEPLTYHRGAYNDEG